MVSFVQTILGVGVVSVLLFPKEIPKYARIFGRISGKSVKFLTETKSSILKSDDSEIVKMKNEIQSSLSEINSIRYEMKDSFKFRNPELNKNEINQNQNQIQTSIQTKIQNKQQQDDRPNIQNDNEMKPIQTEDVSFSNLFNPENVNIFQEKEKKNYPFLSMNFEAPVIKELFDENSTFTDKIGGEEIF
eukprot:gene1208-11298_t